MHSSGHHPHADAEAGAGPEPAAEPPAKEDFESFKDDDSMNFKFANSPPERAYSRTGSSRTGSTGNIGGNTCSSNSSDGEDWDSASEHEVMAPTKPSKASKTIWSETHSQDQADFMALLSRGSATVPDVEQLVIKNLDTGQQRRLGDGALRKSFIELPENPEQLPSAKALFRPWAHWWQKKRNTDETLWAAAETGSFSQLHDALMASADGSPPPLVNSRSLYGRTSLHIAASIGKADCVELLLDTSADLEAVTDAGLTALHIACQRGHLSVAQLLLDWGSDMHTETKDHSLPIHLASANGHAEIVKQLLEHSDNTAFDQLLVRNSMGQRPSEVALDIKTAVMLNQFESRLSNAQSSIMSCQMSSISTDVDHYAGRTPHLHESTVLPHNSRADMVSRLLRRTQCAPAPYTMAECPQDIGGPRRRTRTKKALSFSSAGERKPFSRVRDDAPTTQKVGPESFDFVKKLGKGSFGEVFQVRHRETGGVYAMKLLDKEKLTKYDMLRYAETERNVMSFVKHPYIVSLHFAFQTPSFLVLVMQFCPNGNLQNQIDRLNRLHEPLARLYLAEMVLALVHLHERRIIFRDLKPDNIVLDEADHAVLTDFGLSKQEVVLDAGANSFCGSAAFLAPEILQRKGHGRTVDVYGLGVLLFNMLTGRPPFWYPDRKILFINIKHAQLQMPRYVSWQAASLIESLMERDPSRRLGATHTSDVKTHCFFTPIDFEAVMNREVPVPSSFPRENKHPSQTAAKLENPFGDKSKQTRVPSKGGGKGMSQRRGAHPENMTDSPDVDGWSFVGAKDPSLLK